MINFKKRYKTAVLGSGGQVGSELKKSKIKDIFYFSRKEIDILSKKSLSLLNKKKINIVINLAAITDLNYIERNKNKAYMNNVKGISNLADYCKKNQIFLIHISSDYVYKDSNSEKKENHPKKYYNYYGYTKLLGEKIIKENINNYIIIRTSNIFSENRNNIIGKIIRKIESNQNLYFYNNIIFNPTSARALSLTLIKVLKFVKKNKLRKKAIYNFTQYPKTTPFLFTKYILSLFKHKNKIKLYPTKYTDKEILKRPLNSSMNSEKINYILNLKKSFWKKDIKNIIYKYYEI